MRRVLALVLLLAASAAGAVPINIGWVHPTKYVDGTDLPLSHITGTRIEWGTCNADNTFGTKLGEVIAPAPSVNISTPDLPVGTYCIRAFTRVVSGTESNPTTVLAHTIPPVPTPPTNLRVSSLVVYNVVKQTDRFVMLPVGTVPAGTACIGGQSVNGYYAVPRASVTWTGSVRPVVVVAQCS